MRVRVCGVSFSVLYTVSFRISFVPLSGVPSTLGEL